VVYSIVVDFGDDCNRRAGTVAMDTRILRDPKACPSLAERKLAPFIHELQTKDPAEGGMEVPSGFFCRYSCRVHGEYKEAKAPERSENEGGAFVPPYVRE
jgi:hypothetical protein